MTKFSPVKLEPANMSEFRVALNDRAPSGSAMHRIAASLAQTAMYRRKVFCTVCADNQGIPDPGAAWDGDQQPFYLPFRTGENVKEVRAVLGVAPAYSTSSGFTTVPELAAPYARLLLSDGSSLVGSHVYHPMTSGASTFTPGEIHWGVSVVKTTDSPALASNTLYRAEIQVKNYARVHSCTVYEVGALPDSTVTGVCDPSKWEVGRPIEDAHVQDLLQAGTKLWQHNGSTLLHWSGRSEESPLLTTITGTTWTNLNGLGTGGWTANSPGYTLNLAGHDSHELAEAPVEMGVYCTRTAGTGTLELRLTGTAGDAASWTGITTGATPVYSALTTIATSLDGAKVDLEARASSAGATWSIYGIAVWDYET